MSRTRAHTCALAALALASTAVLGACGTNTAPTGVSVTSPSSAPAPSSTASGGGSSSAPGTVVPTTGPTSGWGPDMWSGWGTGMMGPGMMGGWDSWAPGMMGQGMMGNWYLPGNGGAVGDLDQARQRATAFADRLGLHTGEVMRFTENFYAELETSGGQLATEVLVNTADGAVQLEYGPAMMWNTAYGMGYGARGQLTRFSAVQAQQIAGQWLRAQGSTQTPGQPTAFPGYYTMDTMASGTTVGMLSVNAYTGQVWIHTWHGTYIATSRQ